MITKIYLLKWVSIILAQLKRTAELTLTSELYWYYKKGDIWTNKRVIECYNEHMGGSGCVL